MAKTNSLSFPNMFNVAQNTVAVAEDAASVTSRVKLLILTEPTEIYNEPNQGVGLKKYLWQYNNDSTTAMLVDEIKEQIRLHEPCVNPDKVTFEKGLQYSGDENDIVMHPNRLELTLKLETTFGSTIVEDLSEYVEMQ